VAALRAAGSEVSSQSGLSATKAEVSKHAALTAGPCGDFLFYPLCWLTEYDGRFLHFQ